MPMIFKRKETFSIGIPESFKNLELDIVIDMMQLGLHHNTECDSPVDGEP